MTSRSRCVKVTHGVVLGLAVAARARLGEAHFDVAAAEEARGQGRPAAEAELLLWGAGRRVLICILCGFVIVLSRVGSFSVGAGLRDLIFIQSFM